MNRPFDRWAGRTVSHGVGNHILQAGNRRLSVSSPTDGRRPPAPPERFVLNEREALGATALPLDEESALHFVRLPLLHRDPFDRMLVCQALVHGLTILTPDPLVAQYPAHVLW